MTKDVEDEDLMRRFVVGAVNADERASVERRIGSDPDYFDALCALENEMLLAHVEGTIRDPWRAEIERVVSGSASRRQDADRVSAFRDALIAASDRVNQTTVAHPRLSRRLWLQLAACAAGLAILAGGTVAYRARAGRASLHPSAAEPSSNAPGASIATFVLAPGPTRAEARQANVLRVPPGAAEIRLRLTIAGGTVATLSATLRAVGGAPTPLWAVPLTRSTGDDIEVDCLVPVARLAPGDYLLTLYAETRSHTDVVASRFFSVVE